MVSASVDDDGEGLAGQFWLAGQPGVSVSGHLRLGDCAVVLDKPLVNAWVSTSSSASDQVHMVQPLNDHEVRYLIHGQLVDGRAITLPAAARRDDLTWGPQIFAAMTLLVGVNCQPAALQVRSIVVEYEQDIRTWLRQSRGISAPIHSDQAPTCSLSIASSGDAAVAELPNWTLAQVQRDVVTPLGALIGFLVRRLVSPVRLHLVVVDGAAAGEARVSVLRRRSERGDQRPVVEAVAALHHEGMPSVLQEWFLMTRQVFPSYLTALKGMKAPMDVEIKVLSMAAALERYHKQFVSAGTKNFIDRLADLVNRMPDDLADELAGVDAAGDNKSGRRRWLEMVRDTRNQSAHANNHVAADLDEYAARLSTMAETLGFVVTATYLLHAGMTEEVVKAGLRGVSQHHLMRDRCLARLPEIYGAVGQASTPCP